jgi:anaerobic selenocysteine-containing dehydrogenase
MTNHWNDIDNTSLIFAYGANPAENHPACMAHINAARFGSKNARLIVVDPRLTRTALQCDPARGDMYVRIRPGTNVAFTNGLMKWIFDNIATYDADANTKMLAWHNGTAAGSTISRSFIPDAGGAAVATDLTGSYDGGVTHPLATGYPKYTDTRFIVNLLGNDYQRGVLTQGANTWSNFPVIAAAVDAELVVGTDHLQTVWTTLKSHLTPYDAATVADICGCTATEIAAVAKALIDNCRFKSSDFLTGMAANGSTPQASTYKATTILYAMGQTQHTNGSQNIKDLATIQTLMGNMGRAGGGINALRGIHNVQGSTDWGLLYDNIPGYSGNPLTTEVYADYQDHLFGNRVEGTGAVNYNATTTPKFIDASKLGLQQRGFHNMTSEWFGNGTSSGADVETLYSLWPKGNGVQHIQTFRNMTLADGHTDSNLPADGVPGHTGMGDRIRAALIWGQNPAVTEPNQSKVRDGLKALDLMVVVDMFETETAAVDRKSDGITYLIPACSHVEEAGSVTNSGRWLQWRERATAPKGNSKADLELLLRLAYALDKAKAFTHMTDVLYDDDGTGVPSSGVWHTLTAPINGPAYKVLYGNKFGWTPGGTTAFEAVSDTIERWAPGATAPVGNYAAVGSEVMAERVFKEFARPLNYLADGTQSNLTGGTMWIYSGSGTGGGIADTTGQAAYNPAGIGRNVMPAVTSTGNTVNWLIANKAKSRNNVVKGQDGIVGSNNYPRWGWAWLLNRRVFYNNGEIAGDQTDNFVSPGLVSCLFTMNVAGNAVATWSTAYRKYKTFADAPESTLTKTGSARSPHYIADNKTFMGRFPGHTEPTESPRPDLVATWGHNKSGANNLYLADTAIGTVADYPLVLTSIRCVEHFQGGPITRNNSWNVEAEPVPWIEINSVDARAYGISDGQWVNVITARSNSTSDQEGRSPNSAVPGGHWALGFKARVGVGLQSNQRVAPGVVAIPWHWGDKGLSTGSRANDLCIDAWDANSQIPEYKACLCKIVGL